MNIRKNIYTLTDQQLADYKDAVNALKVDGTYDSFITRHHHSMMTATPWGGEVADPATRNVAHRGPAFLPWHRYFCREFELALQTKRPNVTLPYWDWAADSANPLGAPLWNTNPAQRIYIGGNGTSRPGRSRTGRRLSRTSTGTSSRAPVGFSASSGSRRSATRTSPPRHR